MGRKEQESARKKLRALGILQENLEGIPARLWFRVNEEKLIAGLQKISINSTDSPKGANKNVQKGQTRMSKRDKQDSPKGTNKIVPKGQTLISTKTTTEITTETTTTTENLKNTPGESDGGSSGSGSNSLIFDFSLSSWTETRRQRAEKALEGLDHETAQAVLDELNERMSNATVNKPIAWLSNVATKAKNGKFIPTSEIPDLREAEQRRQNSGTSKAEIKPSQIWKDHKDELKFHLDESDFNRNIAPLQGQEQGEVLLLQAPNRFIADWVRQRIEVIQSVIGTHTDDISEIKVRVG